MLRRLPTQPIRAVLFGVLATALIVSTGAATFSIVARDFETGEIGIAVQSRAFNAGDRVAWVEAGIGGIATQAATNSAFGPRGLALLRSGMTADQTLRLLLSSDEGREQRQVGIVDAQGGAIAHTGSECQDWAGHHSEQGLSVQGNILAQKAVVEEMVRAFHETPGELADRLVAALHAAQGAGGDKRGQQSAALVIGRPSDAHPEYRTRYVNLSVADHPSPIDELERLLRMAQSGSILRAHLRYAEMFRTEGDEDRARREMRHVGTVLERTLANDAATSGELNALAWYCATADVHLEESLIAARRAVDLDPSNSGTLDTLAEVQYRLNRIDDAIATIDQALALAPGDSYLLEQRQRFLQKDP